MLAVGGINEVSGKQNGYAELLGINIVGAVVCLALYFVFALDWCFFSTSAKDDDEKAYGDGGPPVDSKYLENALSEAKSGLSDTKY